MITRGFAEREYRQRCTAAQVSMAAADIDIVLLTTEAELCYFSGFQTPFWRSPTRPWFLLLPREGKPIAIIPSIGAALMQNCYVQDIFTWSAPHADDDGISLLVHQLQHHAARRIGIMSGRQSYLRLPQQDFQRLQTQMPNCSFVDCTDVIHTLRQHKSVAEIEKITQVCDLVGAVFAHTAEWLHIGMTVRDVHRQFKVACLQAGVDDVNYLVCNAGISGYRDVISPPNDTPLQKGDILMLDAGCVIDGYYCDFNRNYAFGVADAKSCRAYDTLWLATEAGLAAAKPGARCCDVFAAIHDVICADGYGNNAEGAGRYGHGVGLELTETPSIVRWDTTLLHPKMVLAIEPSLTYADGRTMVHEENIVITDTAAQLLTCRADKKMPLILSIGAI